MHIGKEKNEFFYKSKKIQEDITFT